LDKGTNPLDPEDFPRTKIGTVLLIIFGILVLVSGFGYLAYSAVMKRKEERFEIERPKLMPRITPPVRAPPGTIRPIGEDTRLREAIRRRDEQKKSEREGLFKAFGEEEQKPEVKELKEGAQPSIEKKEEPKMTREYKKEKKAAKPKKQETKEEVFEKLKAIAKEKRSKPKTK
ncbi:hypothetical protein HYW99_02340, partial [Candidatus Woesearchaeota archaeon]|nr:hypothetical protein [Candidatus Woesearchaeota archaeon]